MYFTLCLVSVHSIILLYFRELRVAPKKIERLEYASNSRQAKRTGGFRINYADMDGDDYFDGDWKRDFYK